MPRICKAAEVLYEEHYEEALAKIEALRAKVELHKQRAETANINYCHCGDLGHVNALLSELNSFLNGGA